MATRKNNSLKKQEQNELPVWPHQVKGGKYVNILQKLMQSLHDEDNNTAHGNQKLFLNDVIVAQLLAFFNIAIKSLRTIEDFSQTKQAQKHLSIPKICKSTLSDFHTFAKPERLQPIVKALQKELSKKQKQTKINDGGLSQLLEKTVAVDGTFMPACAEVVWAIQNRNQHGTQNYRARIDVMLQVNSWVPDAIVVPEEKQGEADSARQHIQPGKIYLFDRGYNSLQLIADHYHWEEADVPEVQSEFVIRLKKDTDETKMKSAIGLTLVEEKTVTDEDRAAGVMSDRVVRLDSGKAYKLSLQYVRLREVVIEYEENGETKTLHLLTNLLDVSAAVIGQLYKHRWQVELFFRWLKCYGNFRHLISQTKEGMQLNLYIAIIGIMLMYLHTGFRPSKYMFSLMEMVASGGATLEEIMPILRERERQCTRDRASRLKRDAKKRAEKISQQN